MKTITNRNDKAHSSSNNTESVVFRCSSSGYMEEGSYCIVLYSDGALVECFYDFQNTLLSEQEIQKKPELVNTIRQLARDYKEQLKNLPRELRNPFIIDGAHYTIQIGRMKFIGSNILTTTVKAKDYNPANQLFRPGYECINDLTLFQKLFEHFRKAINESVGEKVVRIGGEQGKKWG